jgi:hypothetical protein
MLNTIIENPTRGRSRAAPILKSRAAARPKSEPRRNTWQSLGQIVNHKILPMIAAARERDRLVRTALGLPLVNWDCSGSSDDDD